MTNEQQIIDLPRSDLLDKAAKMKAEGFRLVQIGATMLQTGAEVNYSFDKGGELVTYKITLDTSEIVLPSISGIYWGAFLYENEISDLFGIKIENKAIDYKGNFYRTTIKTPFCSRPQGEK